MIRCLLVDDESQNRVMLGKLIARYCPQLQVCGEAGNITDAASLIRKENPQLLFLDIEMPGGNAFELLQQIKPVRFEIIFVTAHGHYAVQAFKYSALDYILKPVVMDDLVTAVDKAVAKIETGSIDKRIEEFLQMQQHPGPKRIALPAKDGLEFFEISEIISCSAEGAYTRFTFTNGKKILASGLLKEFEELLPAHSFCRIHHSHLVNTSQIRKYYRGRGGYVEMLNGETLEVSMARREDFLARFE